MCVCVVEIASRKQQGVWWTAPPRSVSLLLHLPWTTARKFTTSFWVFFGMLLHGADSIKTSALARQRQRQSQRQQHSNNNGNDIDIDNDNETTTPTAKQNNSQTPPIRLYYHSMSMRVWVGVCVCVHVCTHSLRCWPCHIHLDASQSCHTTFYFTGISPSFAACFCCLSVAFQRTVRQANRQTPRPVRLRPLRPLDSYVYDSLFDILSQPQGRGWRRAGQCPRPVMPFDLLLRLFYEPQ